MRNLIPAGLAILVALNLPTPTQANYVDGNMLYGHCAGSLEVPETYCLAYIIGVVDAMELAEGASVGGFKACIPREVTVEHLTDIVKEWLGAHPETRHLPAAGLVAKALAETFSCKA
jgi:Rap1a immunity proteins